VLQRLDFAEFLAGRPSFPDAINHICDYCLKEAALSDYALRRLPQHLNVQGRLSDLAGLLVSQRWQIACAGHPNGRVLSRKALRILVEQFTATCTEVGAPDAVPHDVLAYLVAARWEVLDNPAVLTGSSP